MERITKEQEDMPSTSASSHPETEVKASDNKIEKKDENSDAELDVKSEFFNPLKALYAPDYNVTKVQPKIVYQNMAAFETALKKVGIVGLNQRPKDSDASSSKSDKTKNTFLVEENKPQRRFKDYQMAVRTQPNIKKKHQRNILMQMTQSEGPLKHLQQFVSETRRVKVLIRKEHGIKGYVEGVLKMFDRHWNLLLTDVTECLVHRKHKYAEDKLVSHQCPQDCSDLLQNLGLTIPKQYVKSLGRKRVEIRRHLPQILLRGEHVVLISGKVTQ